MVTLIEWLAREGWIIVSWWALVTLAGAAVLPLCVRLFGGLPDKGYTLARVVGLLLVGYVFWLLAVLGFLRNTAGNITFAWLIVTVGAWVLYYLIPGERATWRELWRDNRTAIITGEVLFVVLLVGWAIVRAGHPALFATEKPMELAFMSAAQRSETFPPNDPWMSGYAISYYHFGYIITAMLAKLSGIHSPVAFNMMIALLFALTGLNTFGVVYNLIRSRESARRRVAVGVGILGSVLMILMSNFQFPLIELPYQNDTISQGWLSFWDSQDRTQAPSIEPDDDPLVIEPETWDYWWWFRASRTINDRHLPRIVDGELVADPVGANVIDEFPQFSFLLADVHPHVLALPFAVLAVGLALNILLTAAPPSVYHLLFYGVAMGGLMFLNVWDGPIYMVVLAGAEGLRRLVRRGGRWLGTDDLLMVGLFLMTLIGLALLFYLPFFISFRSQAAGVIPNVEFPTLFRQYFLVMGPFILLLTPFLLYEAWRGRNSANWRAGIYTSLALWGVLLATLAVLVMVGLVIPAYRDSVLRYIGERGGLARATPIILLKRLSHSVATIVLLAALTVVIARLLRRPGDDSPSTPYTPSTAFALLLVACGAGITLIPEFFYLRDNFGVRINTIFKFYYQAWVMFAVAAAYGVYTMGFALPSDEGVPSRPLRVAYRVLVVLVMVMGLPYAILGVHNRVVIEGGRAGNTSQPFTLDGGPSLVTSDDYQAIMCLHEQVTGDNVVVAEAIGPAYRNQYGRVAYLTGIPTVLGWEGHQRQWRGATYNAIAGSRRTDIEILYNDPRWEVAVDVIRTYGIDYVFYGTTERQGTGDQGPYSSAGEDKFIENLEPICRRGNSVFYRVTPRALDRVGANS